MNGQIIRALKFRYADSKYIAHSIDVAMSTYVSMARIKKKVCSRHSTINLKNKQTIINLKCVI